MTIAAWLMSLVGPMIIQGLIALGVGVLTVTGIDLAVNTALGWVSTNVGGIPNDLLSILALSGLFQAMSYIGGAITARVTLAGASAAKRWFIK
ncbi:DUF2523 domain-containing protein [Trinickia fusca]|uniref:DUF2523 domain-containing protein n=1 Tax=Trinickia fusca TaxID=2419777 RepID=A0A494XFI2_9BURK|nr:DUF2523 domain-containing protein [Trinickia fusca]RKP46854.1 DUF2523 domain-containing protein [Trinickia fusca]